MPRIEGLALLALALLPITLAQAAPATPLPRAEPDPRTQWAALAPAQQREARARYLAWQALPEHERQRLRQAAAVMAALPAAEREALRGRFLAMDRLHRDGWRLGPTLGALYPALQPLFGYLSAEQREPVLALLRQLDARQLAQLGVLSQRTPPQDREALRAELLALPASQRETWLRRKVGE